MVRTQIQLTEEQAKALKRMAARLGVSIAELVRRGVDAILKSSAEVSPEERRRRAMAAVGKFHSGRNDMSSRHDEEFVKAVKR